MPIIPAIQEVHIGRSWTKACPQQNVITYPKRITRVKNGWKYGSSGKAPA
jgi:hypothetical protein